MRIFKNLLLLPLVCFAAKLWAQQPAQYSMYMLNPYQYHTAYAGLDESLSASGVFRKQWVNFPGSPLGFNFNVHLPLDYLKSGVGIAMEHDIIGAYANTSARASYNYIFDFGDKGKLSVGASLRFMQKSLDGTILRAPDGNYEAGIIIGHNDNLIPQTKVSSNTFTADAGIYYKHSKFEAGLTAINLTAPKTRLDIGSIQEIRYLRNYMLSAAYRIDLNKDMSLHPSVLLKTDFIKFQPEYGLIFKYQDNFFGGTAFRGYSKNTMDAVVILAGMQITKNIMLAYSYDVSISKLSNFNGGSHEIMLNYNLREPLGKELPAKVIYNPRFL